MKINIKIISKTESIYVLVDSASNIFSYNGKNINYSIYQFKEKLFDIIVSWADDMTLPNSLDAESYFVEVAVDNQTKVFKGQGLYPNNYQQFKNLILEISTNE